MAKKSMIAREVKRKALAEKYFTIRSELKAAVKNEALSEDERYEAQIKLQKLPRTAAT
jgi:small subunit ribosomal protein S14